MPVNNNIYRNEFQPPRRKMPFTIAMISTSGTIVALDFPPQYGNITNEKIYGVEMMVNPASISNNMAKIINRQQTMVGWVEEHWGEELDTVTFQGSTASFVAGGLKSEESGGEEVYTYDLYTVQNKRKKIQEHNVNSLLNLDSMGVKDNTMGLTTSQRRLSMTYRQFKRIIDLFRINGCVFDQLGMVSRRYHIMLSYAYSAYRGFFESVDVTEDASSPFRFIYTITFKAEETLYSYLDLGYGY